jgi:hypothetical protein
MKRAAIAVFSVLVASPAWAGCHGHLVINRQINHYHAGAFIGAATTFEDAVKETSPSSCWFTLSDKFAKRIIATCEHAASCEVDGVVTDGQELISANAVRARSKE